MTSPVILILGAGANIGTSIARKFSEKAYKVAVVSRTFRKDFSELGYLQINEDLSLPNVLQKVFAEVTSKLGIPSVVVYNAASNKSTTPEDPLSLSLEEVKKTQDVNFDNSYVAAQQAVAGYKKLPEDVKKAFIYTGNILNQKVMPALLTLGVGKQAFAHIVHLSSVAYEPKGYKFYYADERTPDGGPVSSKVSGEAHAQFYYDLVHGAGNTPWLATFVKDKGYVSFE